MEQLQLVKSVTEAAMDMEKNVYTLDIKMLGENVKKLTGDEDDFEPRRKHEDIEETESVRFSIPMHRQRYLRVVDILKESIPKDGDLKTIFEVGCGEFFLHVYMSKMKGVGRLVYLDHDETLLADNKEKLKPLIIEYLQKRESPLRVEAYAGCVTKIDPSVVKSIYAVVGIEIIEHVDEPVLNKFVKSVFGVMKPEIVILTTPNAEFNVNFNLPPGKFRHWDHRFEWTRIEFEIWCKSVTQKYPCYEFNIEGIGKGPEGTEAQGCVSQLTTFRKVKEMDAVSHENLDGIVQENSYKLITAINYPFFIDNTPLNEKIIRAFQIFINCFLMTPNRIEEYIERNKSKILIPTSSLPILHPMPKGVTENQITSALSSAGYKIMELYNCILDKKFLSIVVDVPKYIIDPNYYTFSDWEDKNVNYADGPDEADKYTSGK